MLVTSRRRAKNSIVEGDFIDPAASKTTFREWAERYLDQKLNIGRRTAIAIKRVSTNHLLPEFGDIALGSINSDHSARE